MGNGNTRVADKVCRPVNRYFQTTLIEGRLKIPARRQVEVTISIGNHHIRCISGNQNVNQCLCGCDGHLVADHNTLQRKILT